ncbi:MAG: DUF2141 domain-containing protein [Cyclobacteriaceae bacterium]|nr:DUF2141 domain-containing protein [Cyclobacteriaceae bacterium]
MRGLVFIISSLFVSGFTYAQEDTLRPVGEIIASRPNIVISEPIAEKTYSIHITVTNIRNKEGVIRFKFYDDSTPFPDLNGFLKVVVPKTEMTGDSLSLDFHGFVSRPMAIALLDDENNNIKLDMGWFFPKEGHAFSDYYHSALRRPVYHDFRFILNSDKRVVMRMKYY